MYLLSIMDLLFAFQLSLLLGKGLCISVCYAPFDCFTDEPPFTSSVPGLRLLPQNRDAVNVTYALFVRHEAPHKQNDAFQTVNVTGPHIQSHRVKMEEKWRQLLVATKPTKIIIHDYDDTATNAWEFSMVEKLLAREDCHVITVDWRYRARRFHFEHGMANGRLVGAEVSHLLENIKSDYPDFDFGSVHIIGHGIGAHIASYVGRHFKANDGECEAERDDTGSWWDLSSWMGNSNTKDCPKTPRIGQITGLNPSGRWYERAHIDARLDSTDALFVDVIHSDVTDKSIPIVGTGMTKESGDVDIFPNGGSQQPGCERGVTGLEGLQYSRSTGPRRSMNCNHLRAIAYYLSSMDDDACALTSYPCSRWHDFIDGKCSSCIEEGPPEGGFVSGLLSYVGISQSTGNSRSCLKIGPSSLDYWREHVDVAESNGVEPRKVKAYLKTTDRSPYCVDYVRVELELEEAWSEGVLSFRFTNQANQRTNIIKVGRVSNWGSTTNPTYLVTLPKGFQDISMVSVLWELGVTTSWWPGGGRNTRRELRLPVSKIKITETPSDKHRRDFCTARRRLRSRKEAHFRSCYI